MLSADNLIVSTAQMQAIEARLFEAGMPVAALMEKVAGRVAQRLTERYPCERFPRIGVMVGPGHNGGDALVAARELHFRGYRVSVHVPFERQKELTASHLRFVSRLGVPISKTLDDLPQVDVWLDGLFGFGLERPLEGAIAQLIAQINRLQQPVLSIDLPSGLHTDTGQVLGCALRARQTLCLGLWKQGLFEDRALEWIGDLERLDFDIPLADWQAVLGEAPDLRALLPKDALSQLPLPIPPTSHKYQRGHLLLIAGSRSFRGAALLAALGARASGVGMVTLAVPEELATSLSLAVPEALILGCPMTHQGAIARLPESAQLGRYTTLAVGPGLGSITSDLLDPLLKAQVPLLLDADALNWLAQQNLPDLLQHRTAATALTPHPGEFQRLFPPLSVQEMTRRELAQTACQMTGSAIILKGARTAIALPGGPTWINPVSSASLARGGSGDVLSGLAGGLMAIATASDRSPLACLPLAVWWHAQAGLQCSQSLTPLGVDAGHLSQALAPTLARWLAASPSGSPPLA
jgi:ADP-dependent NAD(P)H-hydrate dehydratase / NAD(P)H-hydrate epimerase